MDHLYKSEVLSSENRITFNINHLEEPRGTKAEETQPAVSYFPPEFAEVIHAREKTPLKLASEPQSPSPTSVTTETSIRICST